MPVEYKPQGQMFSFQNLKRISKKLEISVLILYLIILAEFFLIQFFHCPGEKKGSVVIIYLFNEHLLNVRPVFAKISYVDNIYYSSGFYSLLLACTIDV